jgi:hypothetical protein
MTTMLLRTRRFPKALLLAISLSVFLWTASSQSSPPARVVAPSQSQKTAPDVTSGNTRVSFKRDVLPTLVQRCGYCHMKEDRHGYLIIDPELAYLNLVNIPAVSYSQMKRVEPGKPESSFLIYKMTGEHVRLGARGSAMPTWPLPAPFINTLREWIRQGAKNN